MPSLAGFIDINVTASPFRLEAQVPCNTRASLCVPMNSAPSGTSSLELMAATLSPMSATRCAGRWLQAPTASRVVEV